ncbi:MAG: hypothetical protein V9E94_20060 [Microthrixaceae bacterium]
MTARVLSRRTVDRVAPPLYGLLSAAFLAAPAIAIKLAAGRSGMRGASDNDLLIASVLLGSVLAVLSATRLRSEEVHAVRRTDMWIAAFDALVVLMLGATVLPLVVLWGFTDEHATMAQRGYPVVALWAGLQVVAIMLAEVTGRVVFWWLEPHERRRVRASA